MTATVEAWIVAAVLIGAHLFGGKLRFLRGTPRSRWLSAAGGVSVAYVFVHLLPEVADAQSRLQKTGLWPSMERHAYLVALAGLVLFYGLERAARESKRSDQARLFWVHLVSFAVYNLMIGYVLPEQERMTWFAIAMALHFVVVDFSLEEMFEATYRRIGRWVLPAALTAGIGLSRVSLHPAAVPVLVSFVAGGVILNVLKEELPEERKSSFWAFLTGAGGYAALLIVSRL